MKLKSRTFYGMILGSFLVLSVGLSLNSKVTIHAEIKPNPNPIDELASLNILFPKGISFLSKTYTVKQTDEVTKHQTYQKVTYYAALNGVSKIQGVGTFFSLPGISEKIGMAVNFWGKVDRMIILNGNYSVIKKGLLDQFLGLDFQSIEKFNPPGPIGKKLKSALQIKLSEVKKLLGKNIDDYKNELEASAGSSSSQLQ